MEHFKCEMLHKGVGNDDQLVTLGRIESGKDKLASMSGSFSAEIERME